MTPEQRYLRARIDVEFHAGQMYEARALAQHCQPHTEKALRDAARDDAMVLANWHNARMRHLAQEYVARFSVTTLPRRLVMAAWRRVRRVVRIMVRVVRR